MRPGRVALGLAVLLPSVGLLAAEAVTDSSVAPQAADREVLERVYAESRSQTERRPPGWSEYVGFLVRRFAAWLSGVVERAVASAGLDPGRVALLAWSVLALAVSALAVALILALRRRSRRPRTAVRGVVATEAGDLEGAASWRREIDRRLADGRVAEALEAVWWWLARSLCGDRAEASWTGRELVLRGRRPDLRPPVARLDAWVYGPRRPAAAEVGELVGALEPRLARRAVAGEAGPGGGR